MPTIVALGTVAGLIIGIVAVFVQSSNFLSRKQLIPYFYIVSLVSFIALAVGVSMLLKVGLAGVFGVDIAYTTQPSFKQITVRPFQLQRAGCGDGLLASIGETGNYSPEQLDQFRKELGLSGPQWLRCIGEAARVGRDDLVWGLTISVVGGLLYAGHRKGLSLVQQPGETRTIVLHRAYLTVQLAIFSVAGLVALITGVSDTLRYFDSTSVFRSGSSLAASWAVAIVLSPSLATILSLSWKVCVRVARQPRAFHNKFRSCSIGPSLC